MDDRIVSFCPVCAAPIYGQESLPVPTYSRGDVPPAEVRFSCDCRRHLVELLVARAQEHRVRATAGDPTPSLQDPCAPQAEVAPA
jgi:hypothetical protein